VDTPTGSKNSEHEYRPQSITIKATKIVDTTLSNTTHTIYLLLEENYPAEKKELTDDRYTENVLSYNQNMEYQTTKYSTEKKVDTSTPIVPTTSSRTNVLGDDCFIDIDDAIFLNGCSNHHNVQQQDLDAHMETQSNVMVDENPLTKSVFIAKQYRTMIVVQEAKVVKSNMTRLISLKER
ncbi:22420_t:CDS:2, partial [Gigaspora margarita]